MKIGSKLFKWCLRGTFFIKVIKFIIFYNVMIIVPFSILLLILDEMDIIFFIEMESVAIVLSSIWAYCSGDKDILESELSERINTMKKRLKKQLDEEN